MNVSYRAEIIQKLTAREAIRKRPTMYVGSINGQGILYLVCEVIHNSIEEALAGYCNQIDVDLNYDGSIAVTDNGRGISTEFYPKTEKSFLESVMTTMFARDCGSHERYKVTGGWNGFGLAVVNALSEWVKIMVWREGKTYSQKYERGIAITELEVKPNTEDRAGTALVFKPDPEIFGSDNQLDEIALALRLQQLAYLNPGVKITLKDCRFQHPRADVYQYFNGIRDYMLAINRDRQPLHDIIYAAGEQRRIKFEVALQWCGKGDLDYLLESFAGAALFGQKIIANFAPEKFNSIYLLGFANQVQTIHGGTHVAGVCSALTRTLNAIARQQKKLGNSDRNLSWFELRKGLTGIISVMLLEPEYNDTDPYKWELINPEVENILSEAVEEAIAAFCQSHPSMAATLFDRLFEALPI